MLHCRHFVASFLLALTVSFGLTVAWPSYSSASTYYTFTTNGSNSGYGATGYFSIPTDDFSGDPTSLLNSDIAALSLTFTYPGGSTVFGLSNLYTAYDSSINFYYVGAIPNINGAPAGAGSGSGNLVETPDGLTGLYLSCCNTGGFEPLGDTEWDGNWVTTTTTSAKPLPSTWLTLLSSLLGLGFFAYRGSRKDTAAIAAA